MVPEKWALGGGNYAKVGCSTGMYYTRMTDGPSNDYRFHVLRAPEVRTNILSQDIQSLEDLPQIITENLPDYGSPSKPSHIGKSEQS